eukprot:TRINITY_DN5967_c0_g1_i1.p1 TRINITY_DN5967_c0_g1~~TRINITY_DN5967_c0_g1_i1.p1  ORF type:complete len:573 (-),score=117.95 TRINITY_DN5967_c0_g1_i1:158-1723(-)
MLLMAISHNSIEGFRMLLEMGCSVRESDEMFGRSIAFHVIEARLDAYLDVMLEFGGGLVATDTDVDRCGTLNYAVQCGYEDGALRILEFCSSDEIYQEDRYHVSPLLSAYEQGMTGLLGVMIDKEIEMVLKGGELGYTPLYWCIRAGKTDRFKEMVSKLNYDINITTFTGDTLLHIACEELNFDIIQFLLDREDINVLSRNSKRILPIQVLLSKFKENDIMNIDVIKRFLDVEIETNPHSDKCESLLWESEMNTSYSLAQEIADDSLISLIEEYSPIHKDKSVFGIQICSDLHIEFGHNQSPLIIPNAPYCALLGDIGLVKTEEYREFLLRVSDMFEKVFVVLGNHEFYRYIVQDVYDKVQQICDEKDNLIFFNKGFYSEPGLTLIGSCLWSRVPEEDMDKVSMYLTDYHRIWIDEESDPVKDDENRKLRLITPSDTTSFFEDEFSYIKEKVAEPTQRGDDIVVLTHHSPIMYNGCSNPQYWGAPANTAFATDLKSYISESSIHTWVYGHTLVSRYVLQWH